MKSGLCAGTLNIRAENYLHLILPWSAVYGLGKSKPLPLVVFVQGCGFFTPDYSVQLPQLSVLARRGYVVAMVGHSDVREGVPFPGYLEDIKCAIRFLRNNSQKYSIDSERIAIWGTSSGGNAALMVGLTGDDPQFKVGDCLQESDAVTAVIDFFGPADMPELMQGSSKEASIIRSSMRSYGFDAYEIQQRCCQISPLFVPIQNKQYPSFLLIHGEADTLVPISHSRRMAERLIKNNIACTMYSVEGANHEEYVWSNRVLDIVFDFIDKRL